MLTGKARLVFERWLNEQPVAPYATVVWNIPITAFFAYLEDFLATVDIHILIEYHEHIKQFSGKVKDFNKNLRIDLGIHKLKDVIRRDAINKANEIYNNLNK